MNILTRILLNVEGQAKKMLEEIKMYYMRVLFSLVLCLKMHRMMYLVMFCTFASSASVIWKFYVRHVYVRKEKGGCDHLLELLLQNDFRGSQDTLPLQAPGNHPKHQTCTVRKWKSCSIQSYKYLSFKVS